MSSTKIKQIAYNFRERPPSKKKSVKLNHVLLSPNKIKFSNKKITKENKSEIVLKTCKEQVTNKTTEERAISLELIGNEHPKDLYPEHQIDLLNNFNQGLNNYAYNKLKYRKDAIIYMGIKEKYRSPEKKLNLIHNFTKERSVNHFNNTKQTPFFEISSNNRIINLFELGEEKLKKLYNIFTIEIKYSNGISLDYLSYIPYLDTLSLIFCQLEYNIIKQTINTEFMLFNSLKNMNLDYCNLNNDILKYISLCQNLENLSIKGNNIDENVNFDDIVTLSKLKSLNLSNNKIASYYVNNNKQKTSKELSHIKAQSNKNYTIDTDRGKTADIIVKYNLDISEVKSKTNNIRLLKESENYNDQSLINTKTNFAYLRDILKTNIRHIFNSLSRLHSLEYLDLSNNLIHYFDIDPYYPSIDPSKEQEYQGFKNLKYLDLSHNKIEEEVGILLVINLSGLKELDLTSNPICFNISAYQNIEYEIFKNCNFELKNTLPEKKIYPNILISKDRIKNQFEKFALEKKAYVVNKEKITPVNKIHQKIKEKVTKMINNKNEFTEEYELKELKIKYDHAQSTNNLFITDKIDEEKKNIIEDLRNKQVLIDKNIAAFDKKNMNSQDYSQKVNSINNLFENNKFETNSKDLNSNYENSLKLAVNCLGVKKHYTKEINITRAYRELREVLKNSIVE